MLYITGEDNAMMHVSFGESSQQTLGFSHTRSALRENGALRGTSRFSLSNSDTVMNEREAGTVLEHLVQKSLCTEYRYTK